MDRLLVEARDPDSALALVDELKEFHAELLPSENGHCEVKVELGEGRESQINAALAAVERWITATGNDAAKVTLDGQTYVLEPRGEPSRALAGRLERVATTDSRLTPARGGRVSNEDHDCEREEAKADERE